MRALALSVLLVLSASATALSVSKDGGIPFTGSSSLIYCEQPSDELSKSA